MNFLKSALVATTMVFSLNSPALAYTDDVVLAAIDERVQTLEAQLKSLRIEYRNATSDGMRKKAKVESVIVYARICQLNTAAHWVQKQPEHKNKKIVAFFHLNLASPA